MKQTAAKQVQAYTQVMATCAQVYSLTPDLAFNLLHVRTHLPHPFD